MIQFQRSEIVRKLFYINIGVFAVTALSGLFGFPLKYLLALYPGGYDIIGLFTHMFAHDNLIHVAMNMLALVSVGPLVENLMPSKRFLTYYILMGLVAAITHMLLVSSSAPMLGASGAISGVVGYFCMKYPNMRFAFPPMSAKWVLRLFVGLSLAAVFMGWAPQVAHWAHLGGFFAGIGLYLYDSKR